MRARVNNSTRKVFIYLQGIQNSPLAHRVFGWEREEFQLEQNAKVRNSGEGIKNERGKLLW